MPWALLFGIALLAMGGAMLNGVAGAWLMRAEAVAAARAWADDINAVLGEEMPQLLAGQRPSTVALIGLAQARRLGAVFRYKLFDTSGALVFVSDALDRPAGAEATLSGHIGTPEIAARILAGEVRVATAHGTPPARPAFYSEAYVPVRRNGAMIGIAEVYLDQTARQAAYRQVFLLVEAATAALVLLAGLPPALAAWRRTRERREAQERVRFLAHHDSLTGLPNRVRLAEAMAGVLARMRREGGQVAVLALDLDRFKEVNDTLGHAAGDALLQAVAGRLKAMLREEDLVARLGGDEFVAVQVGGSGPSQAAQLAERLVGALSRPYDLPGGQRVCCAASIGVAVAPADGDTPDALLRAADAALYRAKADGRGTARFFKAEMDAALQQRRILTQELRAAVADGRFALAYQPLFSLPDSRIAGFEALLRWPHPRRGVIPPAEFIPLAEDTGLIVPLGAWVLRRACQDAASWPDGTKVAVNLSPAQFRRGKELVAGVRAALKSSGLAPQRLELEITEGLLLRDTEAVLATLEELRALGCGIAMDDFGTGYSSLAYLWRFPFDKLKIDRALVRGMPDDPKAGAIIATVVALGRALGVTVTAEGVETEAQAAALRAAGCDQGQGFLLGRPAPAAELPGTFFGRRPPATQPGEDASRG